MKKTIYAGPFVKQVLEGHINASERLDIIAARYSKIVKRDCPILTEAQWGAICDVYNGHLHSSADDSRSILHMLEDGDEFDGLGTKWSTDIPELCRELDASGAAGMFAALEVAQRYWMAGSKGGKLSYADQFLSVGARLKKQ